VPGDALVNNGNLLNGGGTYTGTSGTGKGAISFLFRTLNSYVNQGNRNLYDAGGSPGTSNRFHLFFNTFSSANDPDALKLGFGDSSDIILTTNNFVPAAWYYFAMNYDESKTNKQVKWWLGPVGGTLQSGFFSATNGSLAGQGNVFVIGNSTNFDKNSFRNSTPSGNGRIDEFAIWHRLLTTNDVVEQFSALTVSAGPPPTLSIAVSGTNAIISWPSSTDSGYALQSTTNLALPIWSSAGTPATIGIQNVVTNALNLNAQFFRLTKP
jgi:hypothetical protein